MTVGEESAMFGKYGIFRALANFHPLSCIFCGSPVGDSSRGPGWLHMRTCKSTWKPGKKKMAACSDVSQDDKKDEPLLIFYDSEAANGNVHYGDLIEIAATCHPGVVVGSFESFVDTKQQLCSFGEYCSQNMRSCWMRQNDYLISFAIIWHKIIQEMLSVLSRESQLKYSPQILERVSDRQNSTTPGVWSKFDTEEYVMTCTLFLKSWIKKDCFIEKYFLNFICVFFWFH